MNKFFLEAYKYALEQGYQSAYIYLYDDKVGAIEFLLTEYEMKDVYKLI